VEQQPAEHAEVVGDLVRGDAAGAEQVEAEAAADVAERVELEEGAVVELDRQRRVARGQRRHRHGRAAPG
jgi:hypothetical protein